LIPVKVIAFFFFFFNLPNPFSCTMTLGLIQLLIHMNTRALHGGKARPVRKADNITAFYKTII
jgi:hypothetical protein